MATLLTQQYNLNLIPGQNIVVVNAAAYDNSPRLIRFNMFNGAVAADISGWSARVEGTRQGTKAGFSTVCTVASPVVSFAITDAMTASSGKHQAAVVFYQGEERVASATFILNVAPAVLDESTPATEEDATIYQQWLAANTSQIQANANEISVLKGRMDEFASLPPGSTEGNAELVDIRVGYDGTTYPTAGDAVRNQVTNIKTAIHDIYIQGERVTLDNYGQGFINPETGANESSTYSCRSLGYKTFDDDYIDVDLLLTLKGYVIEFASENASTFVKSYILGSGVTTKIAVTRGHFYRFTISNVDNTPLLVADIPTNAVIYNTLSLTDKTLSVFGKVADAGTVGEFLEEYSKSGLNLLFNITQDKFYETRNATINLNINPQDTVGADYHSYCKLIECNAGDNFYISGDGMTYGRLYAFVDGITGVVNVLSKANANYSTNGEIVKITAPANTRALIVNFKDTSEKWLYKEGGFLDETMSKIVESDNPSPTNASINVLIIGNSFSQDEYAYIPALLKESAPELQFKFGILYHSGGTLSDQYNHFTQNTAYEMYSKYRSVDSGWTTVNNTMTMANALADEKWDVIVLQQGAKDSVDYATYQPYLNNLMNGIQTAIGHTIKFVFNLAHSWGNNDDRLGVTIPETTSAEMYESSSAVAQEALSKTALSDIIPCGTAVENARTTSLDSLGGKGHLCANDAYSHLQEGMPCLIPAYVGLLKILEYAGIKKIGVMGSQILPTTEWITAQNIPGQNGTSVGATAENRLIAAKCAIAALKKPYVITDCSNM